MKKLLLALALLAAAPAFGGVKLTSKGKSPNYLFEQDPKALASLVQLTFRSGAMADPNGKEGLAQLSFRSMLRGTKTKSAKEFYSALERMGASVDLSVGDGRVIFSLYALSENLPAAMSLLAEAIVEPALKDAEIEAVKKEELAQLNQEAGNNRAIARRIFRQALFHGTPLAMPSQGTIQSMSSIEPAEVRAFLKQQIRSGSAIFTAATNHSEKNVKGLIEAAFAELPDGQAPALPEVKPAPLEGRSIYLFPREGSATTEVAIGQFGIKASRPDREVLETGNFAFGEDMSSVLFRELREKKGWTYGAFAGFDLFDRPRRHGGAFLIWAFPQTKFTGDLLPKAIELMENYGKNGLEQKELSFAKSALMNSYPFKFATSRARMTSRLYELLEGAPPRSVPEYRRIVGSVTRQSLKQALSKALNAKNLAIVLVGDPAAIEAAAAKVQGAKIVKISDPMAPLP